MGPVTIVTWALAEGDGNAVPNLQYMAVRVVNGINVFISGILAGKDIMLVLLCRVLIIRTHQRATFRMIDDFAMPCGTS
jgi:hypothetical protein